MGNTIVINSNPSPKAKIQAQKSYEDAKLKKLENMGIEQAQKNQKVITQIREVLQENKKEDKTVAKEEKGESR